MLDNERAVLKENANLLANLLTENVPYLLGNYLQSGVISETEREEIISASSAHDIKIKLLEILAEKQDVSLESVMEGLEATENHCVSKEIKTLLSGKSDDQEVNDGAGDRIEDVSAYATNLVDDVISTAEETTSNQITQDAEPEPVVLDDVGLTETEEVERIDSWGVDDDPIQEKWVEASVEVHSVEADSPKTEEEEDDSGDVVDRSVTFPERVATVIEDHKKVADQDDQEYRSHGVDTQNESDNEDDQLDIEKEFVMPTETETNNNTNVASERKPGQILTRMASNEVIIDNEDSPSSPSTKEPVSDGDGLDELMARKALVRQQVAKFEKTAPGGGKGKVQYSFRSSTQDESEKKEAEEQGSNVKNLKNFFQRLSTSETAASPPAGPTKSVGKLKVTFPAS